MTNISNELMLQHQKDGLVNNINADCIDGVINHSLGKKPQSTIIPSPTKLRVEIVDSQVPIQISPPLANINFSSTSSSSSHHRPISQNLQNSRPPSTEPTTSAAATTTRLPPLTATSAAPHSASSNIALTHARPLLTSTPLPHSLPTEKMDYDNDNPFRPNGVLSHEVEPIIEEYKQKPFPSSPNRSAANTPLPLTHNQENLVVNESSSFNANDTTDSKLRLITDNMSSNDNAASNGVSKVATPPKGNIMEQADVQSHLVTPTKAGKVELVHVENKNKKCRCCCIQ